ncbi:MAG TPA: ATP-binding protein [Bryobacteraceae bacterium]|nr:ATP-binding protein [Bryobacteraceae bacterium]
MEPPVPPDEQRRLESLWRYAILDTPPEEAFDVITRLAARLFDAPISLISLLDQARQWFKSRYGLEVNHTSREIAFCAFAIHSDEVMVIPDTRADSRFATNPLVTGAPGIRFYAGAPLITPDGYRVGTLDVMDTAPRAGLTAEQKALLEALARLAVIELEWRLALIQARQTELQLRASEDAFRRLLDNVPAGIYRTTPAGKVLIANQALVEMLGFPSRQELLAADVRYLYADPQLRDEHTRRLEREGELRNVELLLRRRDGRLLRVLENARAVKDAQGNVLFYEGILTDITETRNLEEQLRQAQKMEAIGQLAGAIAHDFNNLLTIINGHCGLLLDRLSLRDPLRQEIEGIRAAAQRGAALTRHLLAFSRRQVLSPSRLDLNLVLTEMSEILRRLIGENIQLDIETDPQPTPVLADRSQIEQVILNLATNARDAMPHGGRLTFRTRMAESERTVVLEASDTGSGIDPAIQARIFEPFFTTKPKGTGLGLSTVYGIIKQSGGDISVESIPGAGATFRIRLPAAVAASAGPEAAEATARPVRRAETVLVAEDDDAVRQLIVRILEQHGYHVLEASSARQALEAARTHPGEIHLLLTDIVMPDMNAQELVGRLTAARPDIKILYMSGYPGEQESEGTQPRLDKPFDPPALARKVREVLDA